MRNFRVVTRGVIVCGCLFASGMLVGGAAAQTAEPVGRPMQLLQLVKPGKAAEVKPHAKLAAKRHAKLAAKPIAKSSAKSSAQASARAPAKASAKASAKTRIASRKKQRSHMVAERKRRHQSAVQVAEAPASDNAWPAAPTATPVDAATLAPAPAPQIVAPVAGATPGQLIVDGQIIQVASADEANEIDLAANDASVASDASLGAATTGNAAMTEVNEPPVKSDSTSAAVAPAQSADVSSTSWFLQVMAALGGAVAAGSVAWFLIGSAPQRMYG
jgi:hypothetical protein